MSGYDLALFLVAGGIGLIVGAGLQSGWAEDGPVTEVSVAVVICFAIALLAVLTLRRP